MDDLRRARDLRGGFGQGLPHLVVHEVRDLIGGGVHGTSEALEQDAPLARGQRAPFGERTSCRRHRRVDVSSPRHAHIGHDLA